jgi:hypothetical protein
MSSRNGNKNEILVYASELASFIRKHRYVSFAKTFETVWSHFDGGNHWGNAVERIDGKAVSRNDVLENIRTSVGSWTPPQQADDIVKAKQDIQSRVPHNPDIREIVFDQMASEYGHASEARSIRHMESRRQSVHHNNKKFYKIILFESPDGRRFGVGGRIDGLLSDGTLVEIKNRQNQIFKKVPLYERIQLETYMRLTDITRAKHVQHLKRSWSPEPDEKITEVHRNDEFWFTEIVPALARHFVILDYFLRVPKWQDVFLLCKTMKEREEFLETLDQKIFETPQHYLKFAEYYG